MSTTIQRGSMVVARDAFGRFNQRRALTQVIAGDDFPVVWICREEEWESAEAEGREPEGIPFPADDVRPTETVDA